jgi:potassium channel subfamily K, other eukaryote
MIQTLIFFLFVGITALAFSQVEKTSYVDGIYYIIVTTLTIGFGDITPQTTIMKVLTFPFLIIGVALLAFIVTSIVRLLEDRDRRRKLELKKQRKRRASESLQEQDRKRERRANLKGMAIGLTIFLFFWFIGALIFNFVEVRFCVSSQMLIFSHGDMAILYTFVICFCFSV